MNSKLVFNELADLGRVQYRKLLTEYKYNEEKIARSTLKDVDEASAAEEERHLQLQSCPSNESTAHHNHHHHNHPELQVVQVMKPTPLKRISCSEDVLPQESPFEVTPQVMTTKPHAMVPFVTPPDTFTGSGRISIQHKQKQQYDPPLVHTPSPDTTSGSHEQMGPLSCNKRRRVSDNYIMGDDTSNATDIMMDSTQYFEEFQASLTGSIPPPPLFKTTGKNGHHSRVSSDSSAVTGEAPVLPCIEEAQESVTVSAQDFIDLIGKLDEVHQGHEHNNFSAPSPSISPTMFSMEGVDDYERSNSMTMIFGKPVHDVQLTQVKKLSPRSARRVLSGGGGCCLELNNSRARMA